MPKRVLPRQPGRAISKARQSTSAPRRSSTKLAIKSATWREFQRLVLDKYGKRHGPVTAELDRAVQVHTERLHKEVRAGVVFHRAPPMENPEFSPQKLLIRQDVWQEFRKAVLEAYGILHGATTIEMNRALEAHNQILRTEIRAAAGHGSSPARAPPGRGGRTVVTHSLDTVPREVVDALGHEPGDAVVWEAEPGQLVLRVLKQHKGAFADFRPFDFGEPTDATEDHDEVV